MLEMVGKQKYFQWCEIHQLLGYYIVTVIGCDFFDLSMNQKLFINCDCCKPKQIT